MCEILDIDVPVVLVLPHSTHNSLKPSTHNLLFPLDILTIFGNEVQVSRLCIGW